MNKLIRMWGSRITLAAMLIATWPGCTGRKELSWDEQRELTSRARLLLIDYTSNASPLLRSHAIEALGQTGQKDAAPFILSGLNDAYWGVRFTACMALMDLRCEAGRALLVERINDPDRSVQAAAAAALHVLGDQQYTSILGERLFDQSEIVRRNTALILGRMGETAAVKLLKRARHDDDLSVRLQVAEAMAVLGHAPSQRLLLNSYCYSSYDDEVILAVLALGRAKCPEANDQILRIFEESRGPGRLGMRLVAARALAMMDDRRGLETAIQALAFRRGTAEESGRIRNLAALALAELKQPSALPYLAPLLTDPNEDVRIAAALAILKSAARAGELSG